MDEAAKSRNLGIVGWDAYEYVVSDFERCRRFYLEQMKVPEVAALDERRAAERGEDAVLFAAGKARVVCVTPRQVGSRAQRWLARHPEGVAVLSLRVGDLAWTRERLQERGATFVTGMVAETDAQGAPYRWFEIATPLGDVRFRFVQRETGALPPGFVRTDPVAAPNPNEFQVIDHVTSNFLTIGPHVAWLREVMGFEEYWRVHFHTADLRGGQGGSGLASIVMWDAESGIKLANNEPAAPNYEASQIYQFVEANHGPGVQHVAFHVPKIVPTVENLKRSGIDFLSTPVTYYDMLPSRLAEKKVHNFRDDIEELRHLGVLVDGEDDRYLLQIFMVEGGVMWSDEKAGPFFYEIIQRRGARGFGEGNFRALFEAIERDQERRTVQVKNPYLGKAVT
ncbi:MAG TPA: VOC family protein [Thermoanaerobaculaceae bacterium]|nr:VOC family protein [Thermoanaerobaculaceae bacterium]